MKRDGDSVVVINNDVDNAIKKLRGQLIKGRVWSTLKARGKYPSRGDRLRSKRRREDRIQKLKKKWKVFT